MGRKPGDLDAPGKVVLEAEGRSLPWWIGLRLQRVGSVHSVSHREVQGRAGLGGAGGEHAAAGKS